MITGCSYFKTQQIPYNISRLSLTQNMTNMQGKETDH